MEDPFLRSTMELIQKAISSPDPTIRSQAEATLF